MPYINQEARARLAHPYEAPQTPGELNYLITNLVQEYVKVQQPGYQTFNDAMGALEGAKLEFYARVVRPFEQQKCHDNGDVYL